MLQEVDAATHQVTQNLPYRSPASISFGLAYTPDGTRAFAADGSTDVIHTFLVNGSGAVNPGKYDRDGRAGTLTAAGDIRVGPGDRSVYPYGLAITPDGKTLLSANNLGNTMSVIDLGSQLETAMIPVEHYPYSVVVAPGGKHAYVSNWEDASLSVIDLSKVSTAVAAATSTAPISVTAVAATISVGDHPTAMVFSPDGSDLVATRSLCPAASHPSLT